MGGCHLGPLAISSPLHRRGCGRLGHRLWERNQPVEVKWERMCLRIYICVQLFMLCPGDAQVKGWCDIFTVSCFSTLSKINHLSFWRCFLAHKLFLPIKVSQDQLQRQVDGNNWVVLCLNVCGWMIASFVFVLSVTSTVSHWLFLSFLLSLLKGGFRPIQVTLTSVSQVSLQTCMAWGSSLNDPTPPPPPPLLTLCTPSSPPQWMPSREVFYHHLCLSSFTP